MIISTLPALLGLLLAGAAHAAPPTGVTVVSPPESGGLDLTVAWTRAPGATGYAILRSDTGAAPWTLAALEGQETTEHRDTVTDDPGANPPRDRYVYRVVALGPDAPMAAPIAPDADDTAQAANEAAWALALAASPDASADATGRPHATWLHTNPGHLMLAALIATFGVLMFWFAHQARRGKELFIRRIPGIDAIEDGIGRCTEMGKPVLYIPGIEDMQNMQTIASMLILGQISKKIAEYQTDLIVACAIPIVREVADEVVKAGFYQAGYPDAYNPSSVRMIAADQFAFTAGTNGIMMREKPATNLYLGCFYAESLILSETGFMNHSIQIAGTSEASQIPFFVAACDYTLIGEELFATSAYLSRDPRLVSSLKASDYIKILCVAAILVGTVALSLGSPLVVQLFTIAE